MQVYQKFKNSICDYGVSREHEPIEINLDEDTIKEYDGKYSIKNYNGNFSLTLHIIKDSVTRPQYQLLYKGVVINSVLCYHLDLHIIIYELITRGIGLYSILFEYKIKIEDFEDFLQHIFWDAKASQRFYLIKYNKENEQVFNCDINKYNGKICLSYCAASTIITLERSGFQFSWLSIDNFDIHAVKFIILLGLVPYLEDYKNIHDDFADFKKHIQGSTDEILEQWIKIGIRYT